jgi:hydrogenase nickel incorporation protein HypA/HybF
MHELSLAESVLVIVQEAALAQGFERVHTLRLSVPALAGVEVAALRFALDALASGTPLDAALIEIDEPPGRACCEDCAREVDVRDRLDPCPACGGTRLRVVGGTTMRVVELWVPAAAGAVRREGAERCA